MKIFAISGKPRDYLEDIIHLSEQSKPKVLIVPTASSDSQEVSEWGQTEFSKWGCSTDVLHLVRSKPHKKEITSKILGSDIVFVTGGLPDKLMRVWRRFKVDQILKIAGQKGITLSGVSAGANCWFSKGLGRPFPGRTLFSLPISHATNFDAGGAYGPTNPGIKISIKLFKAFRDNEEVISRNSRIVYIQSGREWTMSDLSNPDFPIRYTLKKTKDLLVVKKNDQFIRTTGMGFIDAMFVPHYNNMSMNHRMRTLATPSIVLKWGGIAICAEDGGALAVKGRHFRIFSQQGDRIFKACRIRGQYDEQPIPVSSEFQPISKLLKITN